LYAKSQFRDVYAKLNGGTKRPLDFKNSIVLGNPLSAAGGRGLDLTTAHGDGEIGNELSSVSPDRCEMTKRRADLVEVGQHGICGLLADSPPDEGRIGHENIVADDLKYGM
jgi:hypothetical protein